MKPDTKNSDIRNIYQLDGRVPILSAIPFGLQHILAMFVANLAPIAIVAGVAKLSPEATGFLIQNAMFVAGIASMIQLYPIWRIGGRLPIIMGVSFTFVSILSVVVVNYGYGAAIGAVIVGGIVEGILGLFAKYWRRIISPVVAACVVIAIGFSLLGVGARSFGGGYSKTFGSVDNWIVASITLVSCLAFTVLAKSYKKQLAVLFGLIVGYIVAYFFGMVDLSKLLSNGIFSLPKLLPVAPVFELGAILPVIVIFLVSATETIGDTTAMVVTGLDRDITDKEISGSLSTDGFGSVFAGLFGCMPVTSFSQNVGLIAMTKVVNRFTIFTGAALMCLAGLFPPIGAFFATLPDAVLGGCTVMMFGSIMVSGIQMLMRCKLNQKTITVASLSLSIGLGFTQIPELFKIFPQMLQDVFAQNSVAVVFVVAVILNLVLPEKRMEIERINNINEKNASENI